MTFARKCLRTIQSPLTAGLLLAVVLVSFIGCRSGDKSNPASDTASSAGKQYSVRGKVISVDAKDGVISLDTEAIPGFMEAMTMAYTLKNPADAAHLHPGDRITARLKLGAQGAVLSNIAITQQKRQNRQPAPSYHVPQAGESVPDFRLLNQSGREIHLHQFRGKVLILTFIYTRCPFSQFCVLMSHNFSQLDAMLAADPKLYVKTHLLSISFDPKHDTPAVLQRYGIAYTEGHSQKDFQHWDFAALSSDELASVLPWFDVGLTLNHGNILTHSVSTAVIDPEGRIRFWYPSNDWTPQQALLDIKQILSSNP